LNGVLIARLNVPPFIATLGMFGIARGIGFLLSGGMPVPIYVKGLGFLGNGFLFYYHPTAGWSFLTPPAGLVQSDLRNMTGYFPFIVIVMLVMLLLAHIVLSRTTFGLHTYAIGGNKEAAMRAGIPVAPQRSICCLQLLLLSPGCFTTCASPMVQPTPAKPCCSIPWRPW
jgi:ribose transport system permease protein